MYKNAFDFYAYGLVAIDFWLVTGHYICNINVICKENKRIEKYR